MPDVAPHNMTSDSLPVPYVTSSSSNYSSLNPFHAFDSLLTAGHYWLTNGTSTGWLKIDLGAGNTYFIEYYQIQVNTVPEADRAPKDWTLQGSNDDVYWDVLDTVTGETGWTSGELREFTCDICSTAYRYFKLVVTLNNGSAYLQIGEFFLFSALPYKLSGSVTSHGSPVVRSVFSYTRSTGVLYSSTVSNPNGSFSLNAPDTTTEMFIIVLPSVDDTEYNALIFDRVKGVPI